MRFGAWEYILVDNGSSDNTRAVIAEFAATFAGRMRVVREPKAGSGRARNAGVRAARGEIVAFTDDDCYPAPDYLDAVSRCFAEAPELAYLGGKVTLHDPSDYPLTIQLADTTADIAPYSFVAAGVIHGANMAVTRAVMQRFGAFDARRGAGTRYSGDDIELVARLSAAGLPGRYDPRPAVAHHHRRKTLEDVQRRIASYEKGRGVHYLAGLLHPRVRSLYARHWYWSLRKAPLRVSMRELAGAFEYCVRYFGRLNSRRWLS